MRTFKSVVAAAALATVAVGFVGVGAERAVAQQTQSEIVVINMAQVQSQATAFNDMREKLRTVLESQGQQFNTQNQALQQQIQQEAQALRPLLQGKTEQQITGDAALKARVEAQLRREMDLRQKTELFQASAQATAQRAEQELMRALDPIVDQVMTARGATVVVDRAVIAKARPAVDISADVITRFNQSNPRSPNIAWVPVTLQQAQQGSTAPETLPKK